jgi:16S rRNA (adenine1518-N6/adenine1519-N6)-dimethyltransferase
MNDYEHIARKRFGQNFLHDRGVIDNILRAIAPSAGEHIVEIGPGQGALTWPLLDRIGELTVIEIDRDLIPRLQAEAHKHGVLRMVEADVLTVDFTALAAGKHDASGRQSAVQHFVADPVPRTGPRRSHS